jgi:hypothetical protein
LGDTDRYALSGSLRYFSLGYIPITTDGNGPPSMSVNPYEMSADVSYAMKFSETFSGAATFRFIYSDLGAGVEELYPGSAVAVDLAGYYNNYLMLGNSESLLGLGFNISNIGSKISYDSGNTNYFIPTNLRLGASLLLPMDEYNTIALSVDANKYLVPTPPDLDGLSEYDRNEALENYRSISPITGMFKSFNDAPGGMKEELQEVMWSVGAEYAYDRKFLVRGGYFYENPNKGNRQFFSVGAGFKMSSFQMDIAYLISTVPSNPLDKTLRISLSFDMDGLKNLMK